MEVNFEILSHLYTFSIKLCITALEDYVMYKFEMQTYFMKRFAYRAYLPEYTQ